MKKPPPVMPYVSIPTKGDLPALEGAVQVERIVAIEPATSSKENPCSSIWIGMRGDRIAAVQAYEPAHVLIIRWCETLRALDPTPEPVPAGTMAGREGEVPSGGEADCA